jgi:hypothetical protein
MTHFKNERWCRPEDLNPQPTDYKSVALPIELGRQIFNHGGLRRSRTADTLSFNQVLYQLSYQAYILLYLLMAVWTGLEPATSCVTGRHSNQLNYQTNDCGDRI